MKGWKGRLALLACLCLVAGLCAGFACAEAGEAQDITKKCTIKVSEGEKDKMLDSSVRTSWSCAHREAYVGVKLPDGETGGWLRVEWFFDPTDFELTEYDADKNVLRQRVKTDTFPSIYMLFDLDPQTKYVKLQLNRTDQKISNLRVYSAGTLPHSVQQWQPPVEKADVMVVSAHQDDELIFMGGTIPYYATALKKPTVVVYMANCNRQRRMEALNALWKMGVKNYPVFINLKDEKVGSIAEGVKLWGGKDNVLRLQVEQIRRFKPEVIVTHDLDGEYGHNQHKITAQAMKYAIDAAADPAQFPESAAIYGAWQVKKLYHHLYKEYQIMMDWETKLDSLNGYSPLQVAQMGFEEHVSQLEFYRVKSHGTYDNAKFGLYFSTVGEDVAKDDFLENIDPNASTAWASEHAQEIAAYPVWPELEEMEEEHPEADAATEAETAVAEELTEAPATAEDGEQFADVPAEEAAVEATTAPEAAEQPQNEPEPQPTPEPQPAAATAKAGRKGAGLAVAAILLGVAGIGAGGWYAWRTMFARKRHRRRRR